MKTLIRKSWPKIRVVSVKGEKFYQVDGRKKGTNGKREAFQSKKEAEKRAGEIEEDFRLEGAEGLSLSADLRIAALRGEAILAKHGKTLNDAISFFEEHLKRDEHAARAAGQVEDATVVGFKDFNKQANDARWRIKNSPPFWPSLMANVPRKYS